jgi:glutathione synthase/RimK-type ligase-like ATP-grasp enzyme
MKILAITESGQQLPNQFEKVDQAPLEKVAPQIKDGEKDVKISGKTIDQYDAVYTDIPPENAIFARVMFEMIEERGINTNISSTAFFTASKKNYLYYVLKQKNIKTPKTVSLASEKATRGIERHVKGPVIARRFEQLEEVEKKKLDTIESIHGFTEGIEYQEEFILLHEHSKGDKHRCLKIGDKIISLTEDSETWKFNGEKLKYSNISQDKKTLVKNTANALGAKIVEVKLRGQEVYDVNPNPDFSTYENKSGQDVYGKAIELLEE